MSSVVSVRLTSDDPERPLDGHYSDLNYVPWYARATFKVRMHYLDWIIAKREAEVEVWRNSLDSPLADFLSSTNIPAGRHLQHVPTAMNRNSQDTPEVRV